MSFIGVLNRPQTKSTGTWLRERGSCARLEGRSNEHQKLTIRISQFIAGSTDPIAALARRPHMNAAAATRNDSISTAPSADGSTPRRATSGLIRAAAVAMLVFGVACVDESEYEMEPSAEQADGRAAGVVGLTPGESFSLRAQCDEWVSCDLDVNIQLDSIGLNAVYAEAETRADQEELAGDFTYQLPLFRVRITEVAFDVSFEVDVAAEISGSRVAGSAIATDFTLIAGDQRMDSDLLTLFAESEDENAAYDIDLESIQDFDRVVQVRIAAEWW